MLDDGGALRLENQLCFRLYSASKEVVRRYRPYLEPLGLTYTQYLAMMVVWAEEEVPVKELGRQLNLESSTLTPLLKKLEKAGFITRSRSAEDERVTLITLTDEGRELHDRAMSVPSCVTEDLCIDQDIALELIRALDQFNGQLEQSSYNQTKR